MLGPLHCAPEAHAPTAAAYAWGVSRTPAADMLSSTSKAMRQRPAPSAACMNKRVRMGVAVQLHVGPVWY